MSHSSGGNEFKAWALTALSILAAIVFSLAIVQFIPVGSRHEQAIRPPEMVDGLRGSEGARSLAEHGVLAVYTAGGRTVERRPPFASFALASHESVDPTLPAGEFSAVITARVVPPRGEREARFGAEIRGGTLEIVSNDRVLARGTATNEAVEVWTESMSLPAAGLPLEFRFTRDRDEATAFRALWRPDGGLAAHPIPVANPTWLVRDRALNGMVLAQNLNCSSCHVPDSEILRVALGASPAPLLGDVGARIDPQWMREWISDPSAMHAQTAMPRIFMSDDHDEREAIVEDLVHYLVSLGGPRRQESLPRNTDLVATGMVLFHQVGCVACHGAMEPVENLPGSRVSALEPVAEYQALNQLSGKTTRGTLASYLKDPVRWHPAGRMPSLNLTDIEANAIATYLLEKFGEPTVETDFTINPARVERGKEAFVAMGCSSCHSLGENHPLPRRPTSQIPFESLASAESDGCIASNDASPAVGQARYQLDSRDRAALKEFLQEAAQWVSGEAPTRLAESSLVRMNCMACHTYGEAGGPERATAAYFESLNDADLGDEGRIPPTLSHVGSKLNAGWMREVLENAGVARPYMATRMPQFGTENVAHLPEALRAAAGVLGGQDDGPTVPEDYGTIGRHLVGIGGFNCIQCHSIAGRTGVNVPGPDLALAPERLRYEYFERWLLEPAMIHPGTRMPSYFLTGVSASSQLGGDPDRQVDAMWAYLSQGEALALPDGLPDPGGFVIEVNDEPVVFRTFMSNVGSRAIAVGFPEKIHAAFDAETARLVMVWTGAFLNAQGAWGGRGGTVTDPQQSPVWRAPRGPVFVLASSLPDTWPASTDSESVRFLGYELDGDGRPAFLYEVRGDGRVMTVREKLLPSQSGDTSSLRRQWILEGPAGASAWFRSHSSETGGAKVEIIGLDMDGADEVIEIPLGPTGQVTFEMRISW